MFILAKGRWTMHPRHKQRKMFSNKAEVTVANAKGLIQRRDLQWMECRRPEGRVTKCKGTSWFAHLQHSQMARSTSADIASLWACTNIYWKSCQKHGLWGGCSSTALPWLNSNGRGGNGTLTASQFLAWKPGRCTVTNISPTTSTNAHRHTPQISRCTCKMLLFPGFLLFSLYKTIAFSMLPASWPHFRATPAHTARFFKAWKSLLIKSKQRHNLD